MPPRKDIPKNWAKPWEMCCIPVAAAVGMVYSNMTTSHSRKSKKFSFAKLLNDYLDDEVHEFFERSGLNVGPKAFSEYLKDGEFQAMEWLEKAEMLFVADNGACIHACFMDTVETLRDLVVVCNYFESRDSIVNSVENKDSADGPTRKRARRITEQPKKSKKQIPWYLRMFSGLEPGMFCELCDQYTAHYIAKERYIAKLKSNSSRNNNVLNYGDGGMPISFSGGGYSSRFCKNHDPKLSLSKYKYASRRRIAFYSLMCIIREGEKILKGRSSSIHEKLRHSAYKVLSNISLKQIRLAVKVVIKYYTTIPNSDAEESARRNELRDAYFYFYGTDHNKDQPKLK